MWKISEIIHNYPPKCLEPRTQKNFLHSILQVGELRICNFNFNGEYHPPFILNNHCFWLCSWSIFHEPFEFKTTLATDHFLQVVHGRRLSLWEFSELKRESLLFWSVDLGMIYVWTYGMKYRLWVWNRRYGIFSIAVFLVRDLEFFFQKYVFPFFRWFGKPPPNIYLPILTIWQCPFLPRPCWISHQGAKSPAASTLRTASRRGKL